MPLGKQSIGYQQVTDLSSVTALTLPDGCAEAWVQCETQNVRFRADGTNPTASTGQVLTAGDPPLVFEASMLSAVRFLEETSGAVLNVHYFSRV